MARSREDMSLEELVGRLVRESQTLMRQELQLATLELTRTVESVAKAIVRGAIERYEYDEESARAWALDKIEWHNRTRKSVAFGLRHRLGREVNEYLNRFYG